MALFKLLKHTEEPLMFGNQRLAQIPGRTAAGGGLQNRALGMRLQIRSWKRLDRLMSRFLENLDRFLHPSLFHQDIVGIEG